jgi:maleate isomerase
MTDSLGWRRKFAVLIPSTNTSVQPEFDDMRPAGVTNHISRIRIPNIPLQSDADFSKLIDLIASAQDEAVVSAMSCEPDRLVLGISAETFWGGYQMSVKLKQHLLEMTKLPVSMGSEACEEVLKLYNAKTLGVVTPYWPVGDRNVIQFFEEAGFKVKRIEGLKRTSPVDIAHTTEADLRAALVKLDGDDVDALIQVGTNLAMARLAAQAEVWLKKPVFAINTAIYWHALRHSGIEDKVDGFGSLLTQH